MPQIIDNNATIDITNYQTTGNTVTIVKANVTFVQPVGGNLIIKERKEGGKIATYLLIPSTITAPSTYANAPELQQYISSILGVILGGIASITGTDNRITVTAGANPVIDISAAYVGQASITTLGTITTGVWQATIIDKPYGGTGVNIATTALSLGTASTTAGQLTLHNATNAFTQTLRGTNPSASITYDLPTTAPTLGQVLSATAPAAGIVTLSWATAAAAGITIGATTITSGTNTRILYDNAGVVGEYTLTGTGTVVAMQTSPTFVTDIIVPLIYGGTAANEDITIHGTSNATRTTSYVLLQPTAGNVGIGTTSPSYLLSLGTIAKGFAEYITSGGGLDAIKAVSNDLGGTFGVQNLNAGGWSGLEYINNAGTVSVFTGYSNSSSEFRIAAIPAGSFIHFMTANTSRMRITTTGNVLIATTATVAGTSATKTLAIENGTAPAGNVTDCFQNYAADIGASGACPHWRMENGDIVKLYLQTLTNSTGGTASTDLEDVTTAGLADPAKVNNNFTELFTILDNLGLV